MKKLKLLSAAVMATALSLTSCHKTTPSATDDGDTIAATTLTIDSVCCDTLFAYGSGDGAPTCEISICLPFASGANAAELNDSVATFLPDTKAGKPLTRETLMSAIDFGMAEFANSFVSDMTDAADDIPDYMHGAGYNLDVSFSVSHAPDSVLVCQINESSYTGGAHGSYTVSYLNVDERDGHVIKLEELCDEAHKAALTDSIVKQLMADRHCNSLKQLQEEHGIFMLCDEPMVASNFLYAADGITFVYNQYEIAPYAAGIIEVTLPYSTMKAFAPARHEAVTNKQ